LAAVDGAPCPRSSEWCPQSIGSTVRFQSEQLSAFIGIRKDGGIARLAAFGRAKLTLLLLIACGIAALVFATITIAGTAFYLQPKSAVTQVVASGRIMFEHGRATTDQKPMGMTHIESFEDETVMIEINQSVDPTTFVVRREGIATPLTIVETSPRRVRFKLKPPDKPIVTMVIVEAVVTP
jgi:hypothetical protein